MMADAHTLSDFLLILRFLRGFRGGFGITRAHFSLRARRGV